MALSTAVPSVQGMTHKSTIESNIEQLEGAAGSGVSLEKGDMCVTFAPQSKLSPGIPAEKISDMGLEASEKQSSGIQDVIFYFKGN
jgi:hypothetical protein